ncbi:MAG: hypothetical protein AVDCRST_MAG93-9019 [uncultured Chloroflexia bacterium]|uniref:Uncharacterized protein n=1 Tax=uncultured Chloroflexia bacterium TaxID=1672391 RepID=A0A6J4N9B4_9CHLR|nr:MAG: hypothetical protein AVDCRST_MAG93-9019 [uncultured Chloroflexia bacterium]
MCGGQEVCHKGTAASSNSNDTVNIPLYRSWYNLRSSEGH